MISRCTFRGSLGAMLRISINGGIMREFLANPSIHPKPHSACLTGGIGNFSFSKILVATHTGIEEFMRLAFRNLLIPFFGSLK